MNGAPAGGNGAKNDSNNNSAPESTVAKRAKQRKTKKGGRNGEPRLSPSQSHPFYWREKAFVKREYPRTAALKRLFFLPEEMGKEEYKQLLGIFSPDDIPALVAIMRDRRFAGSVIAHHALQFLNLKPIAQKLREKDVAYLMPLFNLATDLDDNDDDEENWTDVVDTLTFVLRKAGNAALGPLKDFATDKTRAKSARSYTFECISGIGADGDENDRQQAIAIFLDVLQGYEKEDKETNAAIASGLCDLKAIEALPLLRPMFAKKLVDESYMGDWSDVLESMGKPIDTSDPLVRVCLHCGEANLVCRRKRSQESKEQMTVALKNADSFVTEEKYADAFHELCCALTCCEDWAARPGNNLHTIYQKRALCLLKMGRYKEVVYDTSHEFWDGRKDNTLAMIKLRMLAREAMGALRKAQKDAKRILEQEKEDADAKRILSRKSLTKPPLPSVFAISAPSRSYNWNKPQHVFKSQWSSPHLHEADEHPFCIGVAVTARSFTYTSSCHSLTYKAIEIDEEIERAISNGVNRNKPKVPKKGGKGLKKKISVDAGMALSVRGKEVVVGSNTDLRIRIWDTESNKVTAELGGSTIDKGHTHGIAYITFDEDTIVSAGHDKRVHIWDRKTGKLRRTLWGHTKTVQCVDYSKELGIVLTACGDRVIREYDVDTGRLMRCYFGHSKGNTPSKFSNPVGKVALNRTRIVSASYSPANEVLIWCRQSGRVVQRLNYPDSWVTSIGLGSVGPDDSGYAFLGMVNGDIHVVALYGGKCVATFKGEHNEAVVSLGVELTKKEEAEAEKEQGVVVPFVQERLILTTAGMDGKIVTKLFDAVKRREVTAATTNGKDDTAIRLEVCGGCGATESIPKSFKCCGGCKVAHYCSVDCQKKDWRCGHREACRNLKK